MSVTYKNSFNSGDLITMLPGMKKLFRETGHKAIIYQRLNMPAFYDDDVNHPIKNKNGVQVCMNEATFEMMKPLLESQIYIQEYKVWQGEKVDFDFDLTRHSSQIPLPGGDIHAWTSLIFPQMAANLAEPWLYAKNVSVFQSLMPREGGFVNDGLREQIIINRTTRYTIPYIDYFFLKEHEDKLVFAGLELEHKIFCEQFKLNVPLLYIKDFLELAQSISSCRFFMGNQSMCWHIADAMKKPRILEVCAAYPNSFPTGKDGRAFISQGALEIYFNELLKETEGNIL